MGEEEARTLYLTRSLDAETTTAFIKRCRAEGVAANSAFTAIANFAFVDVVAYGGLEQDAVNARHYWKGDTSQYLGCHLTLLDVILETPQISPKTFGVMQSP